MSDDSPPPPAADEARQGAMVDTIVGCFHDFDVDALGRANVHRLVKDIVIALSRIPSEEATEELLSEETVQACIVELFDLKSNVVRVNGPKNGSVTTETLVRTVLNAAAKRITRAPGAVV